MRRFGNSWLGATVTLLLAVAGCATKHAAVGATSREAASLARDAKGYRVVVDFDDAVSSADVARAGNALHENFVTAASNVTADEVYVVDTAAPAALFEKLSQRTDVEAFEFDISYTLPADESFVVADFSHARAAQADTFPNDPKFSYQWDMKQLGTEAAWSVAHGDDVIVAVIDTGVARVPDLAQTAFVDGYNFVDNTSNATDDHGHGTHVAGTIAQSTNNGVGVAGVAFGARIMPIKVLSASGSGQISGIASGIRWATDHGAKVINMSLGGPLGSSVLGKAIAYAHDHGVVVVCAAGNDGRNRVSYPAAFPKAIAVAATQFDETTTFYSNWGPQIDLAAPGGNTRVDQNNDGLPDGIMQNTIVPGNIGTNDYLLFMGTSMAAPHVAGAAALLIQKGITNPDAVEAALKASARKPRGAQLSAGEFQERYGAGIVDVGAALKGARDKTLWFELGSALSLAALVLRRLRRAGAFFGASGFVTLGVSAFGLGGGNPFLLSVALPLAAVALLYSIKKLRGVLAGLCLGFAAHMAALAMLHTVDVRFIPNAFDTAWLVANMVLCAGLGALVAKRAS